MINLDLSKVPAPASSTERPAQKVGLDALNGLAVSGGAAIGLNETVEFLDIDQYNEDTIAVRPTSSGRMTASVVVSKNGRFIWFPLGVLTRIDKDMNATCPLCDEMRNNFGTDAKAMVEYLAGKKIKCTKMVDIQESQFDTTNRRPIPGLFRDVKAPYLEWA